MWWKSITRFCNIKSVSSNYLNKMSKQLLKVSSFTPKDQMAGETMEAIICQNSDIKDNEMKVFEFGKEGDQVLLVKQDGNLYAIGNKCTHYGAPLVNGALGKGRVRCPWHGACFSLSTGDIEDFPGLDSLPKFQVEVIAGGGIKVTVNKALMKANKRPRGCTSVSARNLNANMAFVIIGGGPAGNNCAETVRQLGFTGRVVMISQEKYYPYDRIKLSKVFNVDPHAIQLRSERHYSELDVEVMLNKSVVKLDADKRMVLLGDGTQLEYTKAFIATGSRGRKIKITGSNLGNIFTVRTIEDAIGIAKCINKEAKVVIYGSSFIGMEAACYCVGKVASVTIVGKSKIPFENVLGSEIGDRIQQLYTEKGVVFEMNNSIASYEGEDGKVSFVCLTNGRVLDADVCILGIGTDYNTEFLAGGEVIINTDGSVPVDKFLETNVKGVYAGGDIAYAPVMVNDDKPMNIGHWQLAHYHGYIAGINMCGKPTPLRSVPFFWTVMFGLSFRYAGVGGNFDSVVITGSLKDLKFVGYYCKEDRVNAIITVGSDPLAAKFAEMLANGKRLKKSQVTAKKIEWIDQDLF